jgi:chloride channel protein, CIC family
VLRALQQDPEGNATVLEAGNHTLIVTYPDELLHDAMEKMLKHNVGRLPVVERGDPARVVGYLGRSCILDARLRHHHEEVVREKSRSVGSLIPN